MVWCPRHILFFSPPSFNMCEWTRQKGKDSFRTWIDQSHRESCTCWFRPVAVLNRTCDSEAVSSWQIVYHISRDESVFACLWIESTLGRAIIYLTQILSTTHSHFTLVASDWTTLLGLNDELVQCKSQLFASVQVVIYAGLGWRRNRILLAVLNIDNLYLCDCLLRYNTCVIL